MVEADWWSYRRHKVNWFCVSQNFQTYFLLLNYPTRRASRIIPNVCRKNKFQLVRLLKRPALNHHRKSSTFRFGANSTAAPEAEGGWGLTPGSTSQHSLRRGVWEGAGLCLCLPPISQLLENGIWGQSINFAIQNTFVISTHFSETSLLRAHLLIA